MVRKFTSAPEPIPALKGGAGPRESGPLKPNRIVYWASFPKWTWTEAIALSCGLDPDYMHDSPTRYISLSLKAAFDDAKRLIERAMPPRWGIDDAPPAQWLALAKSLGLPILPELESAVATAAVIENTSKREALPAATPTMPKPRQGLSSQIFQIADRLWPDGKTPARVKDRNNSIIENWPSGQTKPSSKTIGRAFKNRDK